MKKQLQQKKKQNKEITIMIMNDTGKKPFQIRIPTMLIKVFCCFVVVVTIIAGVLFGRNLLLDRVVADTAADNKDLNAKVRALESNQDLVQKENQSLKETVEVQESQVQELKSMAEDATQKLNELYEQEESIYQKIDDVMGKSTSENTMLEERMIVAVQVEEEPTIRYADVDQAIAGLNFATSNIYGLNLHKTGVEQSLNESALATKERFADLLKKMDKQREDYASYGADLTSAEFARKLHAEKMMNLRQGVVDYAKQFLGGRYIYGGSNPHIGADCSGFTGYILGNKAGVWLNRTAAAQSQQGKRVTIDEAKPGDLIFYAGSGGGVNHVAMYIGNGRVIHSSNERNGVMISTWNYRTPVVIRNMIGD